MSAFVDHRAGPSPWRAELRATVTLALPLIGTQLAQIATMTTDVVLLGRLGPDALAAGALGANVVYVLITFTLGVLMAVSPMVAHAMGRKLHAVRDARRSVRQGLWVAVAVGVYVGPPTVAATGAADVKVMVCVAWATAKDCCTCGAGL